jgi:integrase
MLRESQIQAALKSTKPVVILNDGSSRRGTGSLLLVVKGGRATWFGRWYESGRQRKKQLGHYPALNILAARKKFTEEVAEVLADNKNPKSVVQRTDQPTVGALLTGYVASMKASGKASWYNVDKALLTGKYAALDHLGKDRLARDVTAADISSFLEKTFKRGSRVTADRCRSYLSAAFNWAIKSTNDYTAENRQDWGLKFNPVAMVKKDVKANKTRDRNLSNDEIKALWHGLNGTGYDSETVCAVRMVLLCGQRVLETLRMEGSEIDLKEKVWRIPAHKTKLKKRPHNVPLPDLAVPIVELLISVHGDGYLFASPYDKSKHITAGAVQHAVARYCDNTGAEYFQPRDLRRTWKSRTGEIGIDRFTRDLIQQHAKDSDTGSKHYDFADYFPKMREAMNQWNQHLDRLL